MDNSQIFHIYASPRSEFLQGISSFLQPLSNRPPRHFSNILLAFAPSVLSSIDFVIMRIPVPLSTWDRGQDLLAFEMSRRSRAKAKPPKVPDSRAF
jgi:hypothetical protein